MPASPASPATKVSCSELLSFACCLPYLILVWDICAFISHLWWMAREQVVSKQNLCVSGLCAQIILCIPSQLLNSDNDDMYTFCVYHSSFTTTLIAPLAHVWLHPITRHPVHPSGCRAFSGCQGFRLSNNWQTRPYFCTSSGVSTTKCPELIWTYKWICFHFCRKVVKPLWRDVWHILPRGNAFEKWMEVPGNQLHSPSRNIFSTLPQSESPAFSLGFFTFLSGFLEEEFLGARNCIYRFASQPAPLLVWVFHEWRS